MNPKQPIPKYGDEVKDASGKVIGTAVFDPNTGKALAGATDNGRQYNPNTGEKIPVPKVPNVINSEMMQDNKGSLVLPESTTPPPSTLVSDGEVMAQTAIEKRANEAQKTQDKDASTISKLLEDIGATEAKRTAYQEEAGVFANQDAINNIDDQILIQTRALKAKNEEIRKNPFITQNMAAAMMSEEERKATSTTADLMIQRSLFNRDVDRAIGIADRKVEAELAPLKAQLDAKKFLFDNNKDWLSTLQKTALNESIKKEERAYDAEKDKKTEINKLVITALQNGADAATIEKIKNAKDVTEASVAIGKYASDPLERKIKEAQLAKINQDMSQDRVKFNERNSVVGSGDLIEKLPKAQQDRYYKLQNDFDQTTKTYRGAIDAANNIKSLSKDSTAQDQTAIIFSYMKTLDPSSTVREGEFALVGKTAGLGDQALNALRKLDKGKRLNESQINDILGASGKLATQAKKNLDASSLEYDRRASKFGLPEGLFYEPQDLPKLSADEIVEATMPDAKTSSPFSIFNHKFK